MAFEGGKVIILDRHGWVIYVHWFMYLDKEGILLYQIEKHLLELVIMAFPS
jgi:hypothetical protein